MQSKSKIIGLLLVGLLPAAAFAAISPTTIYNNSVVSMPDCDPGITSIAIYRVDTPGTFGGGVNCLATSGTSNEVLDTSYPDWAGGGPLNMLIFSDNASMEACVGEIYATCKTLPNFLYEQVILFVNTDAPAGFSLVSGATINSFLVSAGSATLTTGLTLWPIAAVVVGIILAFFTIRKVLALFPNRKR